MSEEPKRSYSAREIVLELFPATDKRLIPKASIYRLHRSSEGRLEILDRQDRRLGTLEAVEPSGNPSTQLCCDLCGWSASREHLQMLRAEVPGSDGRRYRYVTACRRTEDCEARRVDDEPVRQLLKSG